MSGDIDTYTSVCPNCREFEGPSDSECYAIARWDALREAYLSREENGSEAIRESVLSVQFRDSWYSRVQESTGPAEVRITLAFGEDDKPNVWIESQLDGVGVVDDSVIYYQELAFHCTALEGIDTDSLNEIVDYILII